MSQATRQIVLAVSGASGAVYARALAARLLEAGCRTIGLTNHFQNNMNVWGLRNMCCTVDLKIAKSVGEGNVRRFCRKAKAGGAIVAPETLARAAALGLDAKRMLANNDGFGFFQALGDLVVTGPTRTNVNDYRAILVQ